MGHSDFVRLPKSPVYPQKRARRKAAKFFEKVENVGFQFVSLCLSSPQAYANLVDLIKLYGFPLSIPHRRAVDLIAV